MVKPYAVLLFGPVARSIFIASQGWDVPRRLALAGLVAAATMLFVSLPLWAGGTLLKNVLANPASEMYTNTLWEGASDIAARLFNCLDRCGPASVSRHASRRRVHHCGSVGSHARGLAARCCRCVLPTVAGIRVDGVLGMALVLRCRHWHSPPSPGRCGYPPQPHSRSGGCCSGRRGRNGPRGAWSGCSRGGRSVLFGPVVLTLTWSPARRLMFMLLGLKPARCGGHGSRRRSAPDRDRLMS